MSRPLIGVTTQRHPGTEAVKRGRPLYYVSHEYADRLRDVGGVPLLLPPGAPELEVLEHLDGVLFTGGEDVAPVHFAQAPHPRLGTVDAARDAQELPLARAAVARGLPVFAICRGVQLLNVALGGSLYQDLPSERPGAIAHDQPGAVDEESHAVEVASASMLGSLVPASLQVNSFHHQAVRDVAPGLRAVGWSPDGLIEALEGHEGWVLGVQWHPELMPGESHTALFRAFVAACAARRAPARA